MGLDSEVEYIEDSEPERWQHDLSFGSRPSLHPQSSPHAEDGQAQATHDQDASTSRFFATVGTQAGSPTKRRRTSPPSTFPDSTDRSSSPPRLSHQIDAKPAFKSTSMEVLDLPPAAQPRPSARTESTAATATTTSHGRSSKRKSGDPIVSDKEKKPRKRHSSSSAAGGIVSAKAMLKEDEKKKKEKKEKKRRSSIESDDVKVSSRSKKGKEVLRLSISSVEPEFEMEVVEAERVKEEEGSDQDALEDIPVPPRLNDRQFTRALYGLPALKPAAAAALASKEVKTRGGKGKGKKKRDDEEREESTSAEDDEELDAAAKMRKRLGKHKYQGDSRSASRSLSAEDMTAIDVKPSVNSTTSSNKTSSSSSKIKKKKDPEEEDLPLPISLPSEERLKALTSCPLCSHLWTTSKTAGSKSTHLLKCARTNDYTSETVRILVENQLLSLAHEVEVAQRDAGIRRTAFDRALGVGEGLNHTLREVRVVGIEGVHPALEEDQLKKVQAEVDKQRKKVATDKVVKLAKEIKQERKTREDLELFKRAKERVKAEEEEEAEVMMGPRATGLLVGPPQSTGTRKALHRRAGEVLDKMGGTGLTQQPTATSGQPASSRKPVLALDFGPTATAVATTFVRPPPQSAAADDTSDDLIIVSPDADLLLPSTQPFPASKLVHRYEQTKEMEVVIRPPPSKVKSKAKVKRKSEELELSEREEEGGGAGESTTKGWKGSLWNAAGGKDDEIIRRVVLSPSPSPPFASVPTSPDSALAPTDDAFALSPTLGPSPTRSRSTSTSTGIIILDLDTSTELDLDLGLDLDNGVVNGNSSRAPPGASTHSPPPLSPLSPPQQPSQEEIQMHEGMRTLGLQEPELDLDLQSGALALDSGSEEMSRDEGQRRSKKQDMEEEEDEVWVDEGVWEDGEEDVLVWEGGGVVAQEMEVAVEWREDEGVISGSDEEPLAEVSRRLSLSAGRLSKKASKGRRSSTSTTVTPEVSPIKPRTRSPTSTAQRAASPPHSVTSPSESSDLEDPPPPRRPVKMPDYTALPIADLQKQVAKFGFRSSKERSVLVNQLEKVWMAMHPQELVEKTKKKKAVAKKKQKEVPVEEEEEVASLGERLRAMVVGDQAMYMKVLRYEPILFEDVVSLAAAQSIKCAKPLLMKFLDEQSVTYYTEDPTNGSRRRYR